jgi:RNase P subunit RPR2
MGKREEEREEDEEKREWEIAFRIKSTRKVNMKLQIKYPRAHLSVNKYPNYICAYCTKRLLVGENIRFETTEPNKSKVKTYWCENCYQTK